VNVIYKQLLVFNVAIFLAVGYWLTQALSILFPGTALVDPEFGEVPFGGQLLLDTIIFILLAVAYYLHHRKYKQTEKVKGS
jgi:hypothetical protein